MNEDKPAAIVSVSVGLAERLGGEVVLLRAGEVAKTLIQHAAERRASLVLVGHCS